jgi:hypothetical protein
MKQDKYKIVDLAYRANIYPDLWHDYHNFLIKYKNIDRMHLHAVELYDRHLDVSLFGEYKTHPQSQLGMFIRACISAGYAKAKLENKTESEVHNVF